MVLVVEAMMYWLGMLCGTGWQGHVVLVEEAMCWIN